MERGQDVNKASSICIYVFFQQLLERDKKKKPEREETKKEEKEKERKSLGYHLQEIQDDKLYEDTHKTLNDSQGHMSRELPAPEPGSPGCRDHERRSVEDC